MGDGEKSTQLVKLEWFHELTHKDMHEPIDVALAGDKVFVLEANSRICVYKWSSSEMKLLRAGKKLQTLPVFAPVSIACSNDGKRIFVLCDESNSVVVLLASDYSVVSEWRLKYPDQSYARMPYELVVDEKNVVFVQDHNQISAFSETGEPLFVLNWENKPPCGMSITNGLLYVMYGEETIMGWDKSNGVLECVFKSNIDMPHSIAFLRDAVILSSCMEYHLSLTHRKEWGQKTLDEDMRATEPHGIMGRLCRGPTPHTFLLPDTAFNCIRVIGPKLLPASYILIGGLHPRVGKNSVLMKVQRRSTIFDPRALGCALKLAGIISWRGLRAE